MSSLTHITFNRSTLNKNSSRCQFILSPENSSDYIITISDVNITAAVDSSKFLTVNNKAEQYASPYFDAANSSITYYYKLKKGKDYTINITNTAAASDFTVTISQDNWVYAPNGGIRKGGDTNKNICLRINEVFLTDAQICTMYDAIAVEEIGRKDSLGDSGMWAYEDAEDFLKAVRECEDKYLANFVNANDVTKRLSEQLEFTFVDPSSLTNAYGDFSLTADVALAFVSSKSYSSVLSTITSKAGDLLLGLDVVSALISHGYECKNNEFANALIKGRFNICVYEHNTPPNNWVTTIFSPSGCNTWKSRSNVGNNYLNKYAECRYTNQYTMATISEILRCDIVLFD